jgi:FSR family fosmidomycin resistance protein-like MFS transporter
MSKPKTFQKGAVFTVSFAHLAHDLYSSFLAPMLPLLIEKLGLSLAMASLFDIIRRAPFLLNPFLGLLAERVGARYFVILTPALTGIAMSLVGIAPSVWLVCILLFVAGISAALFHIPSPVMIKEASGNRVGLGMSFFMVGGEGARALGPLVITAGIAWWGLEGTFRLMPIGIVASLILYFKLRNLRPQTSLQKPRQKGDVKVLLIKYAPFFTIIGSFILFQAWMKTALVLFLPVYLKLQGLGLWYAGISLAILELCGVLGVLAAGHYSDKVGRHKTLMIIGVAQATFMAFFMISPVELLIPLLACIGFFLFASGPVLMASVQDTDTAMPTFMNSLYMSINFGVSSIVVLCVGLLGDAIGLETTYWVCTIMSVGCIGAAALLPWSIRAATRAKQES